MGGGDWRWCIRGLFLATVALGAGCEGRGDGWEPPPSQLSDLGGDGDGERDAWTPPPADVAGPVDVPRPRDGVTTYDIRPVDIQAPPEVNVSLEPDCPAVSGGVHVYFSKPVARTPLAGAPAACGEVPLDRALAYWVGRAQRSVRLASYSLDAQLVTDALIRQHRAGLDVSVIVDDEKTGDEGSVPDLVAAGVSVTDDDDARLMHHKFAVIDERWVWLGSANASVHDGRANANNILVFDSPDLATIYLDEFDRLARGGFHANKGAGRSVTLEGGSAKVFFAPSTVVEDELERLIRDADHEIYVSMYAFTRQGLADALLDRCGEVDLVVVRDRDSVESDSNSARLAGCSSAQILLDAVPVTGGVSWPLSLHHKVMVIDGQHPQSDPVVVTGSMNWSKAGLSENDEGTLIWHDADTAAMFVQELKARVEEAGGQL